MRRPSSENIDGGGQYGGQGQVTVTAPDWNQHPSVRKESWAPLARRVPLQLLLQVRALTLLPAQALAPAPAPVPPFVLVQNVWPHAGMKQLKQTRMRATAGLARPPASWRWPG